jgi:hypothetical protein
MKPSQGMGKAAASHNPKRRLNYDPIKSSKCAGKSIKARCPKMRMTPGLQKL